MTLTLTGAVARQAEPMDCERVTELLRRIGWTDAAAEARTKIRSDTWHKFRNGRMEIPPAIGAWLVDICALLELAAAGIVERVAFCGRGFGFRAADAVHPSAVLPALVAAGQAGPH